MRPILVLFLFALIGFAEDKPKAPPQPTQEERLALMQLQRDWLIADRQAHDKAEALDKQAQDLAAKYHCKSWNADFTCTIEEPKEKPPVSQTAPKK